MHTGKLSIIATPIGNLADLSIRAKETIESVDLLLCEDTRVTKQLLARYDISVPTKAFHQHTSESGYEEVLSLIENGEHIGIVTDAGTPGISDPGNRLVAYIRMHAPDAVILPVPGPSALVAALSVSGFPTDSFLFLGFPPHKKKRQQFFEHVAACPWTVAFYESNHRIHKALGQLAELLEPDRMICIGRELTKAFETVYHGTMQEIMEMEIPAKGEFVVIVRKP